MSEPARDLPADSTAVADAVENARRGDRARIVTVAAVGRRREVYRTLDL